MVETVQFQGLVAEKSREATTATIERLSTVLDRREDSGLQGIGNAWSRLHYGSEFGLVGASRNRTAMSLVLSRRRMAIPAGRIQARSAVAQRTNILFMRAFLV